MTTGTDQIVEPPLHLVICPPLYPDTPDIPETAVESERLAHALESLTAAQTTTASAIEQIALAAIHIADTLAALADATHTATKSIRPRGRRHDDHRKPVHGGPQQVCIPMDKYEQMLDAVALVTNMRNQALIKEAEKKEMES